MKLNNLEFPDALQIDLTRGVRPLAENQKRRLASILIGIETAIPELFDIEGIREANRLWSSAHVEHYLGHESENHRPGNIDPLRTLIIGQAEPDSPIALDYRVSPPCVVYFGDEGYWLELCPNYEALVSKISGSAPDSPP
jgi:hypothetical protein